MTIPDAVRDAYERLVKTEPPHGLLPLPSLEDCVEILGQPDGDKSLNHVLALRRQAVAQAEQYPLRSEPEPDLWHYADDLLRPGRMGSAAQAVLLMILLGGNRSSKSRYCGKRLVQDAVDHPNSLMVCLAEDAVTSMQTQQDIIWHYLPPEWKALNGKKSPSYYISFRSAMGFSERRVVLPNHTKIFFKTYNEEAGEVEGWEFGNRRALCIGWWADENLRLPWLMMFRRRGRFRPSIGLWSFTPISGMTPAIKEAVGAGKIIETRPAKLLPDRVNVPGLPRGHMPFIQKASDPTWRVIYFHTEQVPFGAGPNGSRDTRGKTYFDAVAEDCAGKPSEYVQRIAYGWCTDTIGRAFPKFGPQNVIRPEQLPAEGTNYLITDPHGDRPWASIWVRVAPGRPSRFYVYRDWPDKRTYGEWAVPTSRATTPDSIRGWDGDEGPAQRSLGWAFWRYKTLWLDLETVPLELDTAGFWEERDPHRVALLDNAMEAAGVRPLREVGGRKVWDRESVARVRHALSDPLRETIRARYADPRAAANPQANEKGGANLIRMMGEEQRDKAGRVIGPRMLVLPAYSGKGIDDGLNHVNDLLDYDENSEVVSCVNEPRLFVTENCEQLVWCLTNYTGRGGEDGASKDFADLARYMAQTELRHVEAGGRLTVSGHRGGPV